MPTPGTGNAGRRRLYFTGSALARISPQKGSPLPGKQETVDPTLR